MAVPYQEAGTGNYRKGPNPLKTLIVTAGVGIAAIVGIRLIQNGDNVQRHISPVEPVPTLPGFISATAAAPAVESVPYADGIVVAPEGFTPPTADQFREQFPSHIAPPDFILTANDATVRKFFEAGKTAEGMSVFGLVNEAHQQMKSIPHPLLSDQGFRQQLLSSGQYTEESLASLSPEDLKFKTLAHEYILSLQQTIDSLPDGDWQKERLQDLVLHTITYDRLYLVISNVYTSMALDLYGLFDYFDKSVPRGTDDLVALPEWNAARDIFQTEGLNARFLIDTYIQITKQSPDQRQYEQSFARLGIELDRADNSPWETQLNDLLDDARP